MSLIHLKVGKEVIARTNSDEPILRGIYIGVIETGEEKTLIPVIRLKNGQEYPCFGIVVPYRKKLNNKLRKMTNKEQWDFLLTI